MLGLKILTTLAYYFNKYYLIGNYKTREIEGSLPDAYELILFGQVMPAVKVESHHSV